MGVRNYLDRILETYSQGNYYDEVKKAKEEYFDRAGRVAEGSEKFELQMNAFVDWYVFDRPLSKVEVPPVNMFVNECLEKVEAEEREIYTDLTKSIHSLFELLKVRERDVYVRDLFDGEKYVVEESDINKGFSRKDIFETRLLKFRNTLVFGSSFIFHPTESRSFILKQIKQIKYLDVKQRVKLMHKLANMRLKVDQYSHIDVKHIYTETPLF